MTKKFELRAGMMNMRRTIAIRLYFKWYSIATFKHDKDLAKAVAALRAIPNLHVSTAKVDEPVYDAKLITEYDIDKQYSLLVKVNSMLSKTIADNIDYDTYYNIAKLI